ncbi:MAG: hypothetical protein ACYDH9_10295 [Limisphaerales bacterium]
MNKKTGLSRREFARASVRYFTLGALLAVAALLTRRSASGSLSSSCVNRGLCGDCAEFVRCALPPARSTRRAMTGTRL